MHRVWSEFGAGGIAHSFHFRVGCSTPARTKARGSSWHYSLPHIRMLLWSLECSGQFRLCPVSAALPYPGLSHPVSATSMPQDMTDRNLLFGLIAMQSDLIEMRQFVVACTLWGSRKDSSRATFSSSRA